MNFCLENWIVAILRDPVMDCELYSYWQAWQGEGKMPRMNEETVNLQLNKGAQKLKGREILGCAENKGKQLKVQI